MNHEHAKKIDAMLADDALVIDVGGGAAAFPRADWIIDALAFEDQGCLLSDVARKAPTRFTRDTWVQFDICHHRKWPFEDNQFDFAVCSHLLEDVRDPIWVCSEMSRISKAGYIEVPSRHVEQSLGIEHPCYAGYYHHRWLVSTDDGRLEFRHKPHLLHTTPGAIVAKAGWRKSISPQHEILSHYWEDQIHFEEVIEFDEQKVVQELCDWSLSAKNLPDLLMHPQEPMSQRLRRAWYFTRLRWLGR